MLTTLQTSYTDTRSGDLAWRLGGEPLPALAVLDLGVDGLDGRPGGLPGATLQLRLLGASHQVVLAAGPGDCLETVACLPGRQMPLPARVAERVAGWEYEFAARIEALPPHTFAARAQELLALVEEHPRGLAGIFPGDPCAFTALVAQCEERRVLWRTWHAYPQEGRLVCTRSSLVLRGGDDRAAGGTGGADGGITAPEGGTTAHG